MEMGIEQAKGKEQWVADIIWIMILMSVKWTDLLNITFLEHQEFRERDTKYIAVLMIFYFPWGVTDE